MFKNVIIDLILPCSGKLLFHDIQRLKGSDRAALLILRCFKTAAEQIGASEE